MSCFKLHFSNIPLSRGITKLTEKERDKIDADAMSYIQLCNETLTRYKKQGEWPRKS